MPDPQGNAITGPTDGSPRFEGMFNTDRVEVLLVDDQMMIGEAVRRLLSGEPDIVYHYCSAPGDALDNAKAVGPTVILQDLIMPDIDGLELLRRYRSAPEVQHVPVIVLSTKEEPAVKKQAFELGASDYLVKLPDRIELIARIRHHSRSYMNRIQRDAAMRALDLALRQKNEFMRIASHDLKNPLTVMIAAASILRNTADRHADLPWMADTAVMIGTIERQAQQMHKLIVDYLDAQAMEDGQLKIEPANNDLQELARNAVSDLQSYAASKHSDIRLDMAEGMPRADFDAARVGQVAVNLISNAVKFSPPGASITVRCRMVDNLTSLDETAEDQPGPFLAFEVADDGPGLQAQDRAKLFGRYATLSAKPTGEEKSTGLGLAISKCLIELHQGRIGARNNATDAFPNALGSTFWFALPVAVQA